MKVPEYARFLENRECCYPIEKIHYDTRLVTLRESTFLNVYNTLSIRDVEFCFDGFTQDEIDAFMDSFKQYRELCKDTICKEIEREEISILKKFVNRIKENYGVFDDKYGCNCICLFEHELDSALEYFIEEEFTNK